MRVIKRDGRKVLFQEDKVKIAVLKAFKQIDGETSSYARDKADAIAEYIAGMNRDMSVEEIQDIVEAKLMACNRKDVAKAYIIYRNDRSRQREKNSALMKKVGSKIKANNVQNQNANVDEKSFGGRIGEASGELLRQYAIDNLLSDLARENHLNNEIYIHDLDHYAVGDHNCLSVPFDKLLAEGFNTRQTDVRPAQSVNTAFQLVAVLFQLQSLQQFGGVSATHLDHTMIPYVRKSFYKHYVTAYLKTTPQFLEANLMKMLFDVYVDDAGVIRNRFDDWVDENKDSFKTMIGVSPEDCFFENKENLDPFFYQSAMFDTINETYQAVEGLYHNLNTLQSRSGCQLPFTSINYGTCTTPEGRLITKAILDVSIKGIGKLHKTSIFPCGIFQCMKGVNRKPGEPNYDLYRLALRSTAKRLYPNYANVDWSGNAGYDKNDPKTYFSTMGCRTVNGADINAEPGTNPQTKDGRGNICPVTIILPQIAMEAKELCEKVKRGEASVEADILTNKGIMTVRSDDGMLIPELKDVFISLLDQKIHEAKDMLIERYEYICSQSADSAKFMYENGTMLGYHPEEGIRSALKHGTLVIGQIGLAEALQILVGCDHTTEKGMEFAKRIEQLFKDRCAEFKQGLHLNFGVYYTPAENLCYTSMQKFKDRYGVIENVSDKDFFTNSIHVPVWINMDPFQKIDIESQLTGYSNAGCITYTEIEGSVKNNIDALEEIVNYAMDSDIPYFAVNVPNDTCMGCGYCDEINDVCPKCGSTDIQRLRRVTGYLTGNYTTAFNKGKQQEVEMRVKHWTSDMKLPENWE